MARPQGDPDGERKPALRAGPRPRKTAPAPWVEARPIRETVDEEWARQDGGEQAGDQGSSVEAESEPRDVGEARKPDGSHGSHGGHSDSDASPEARGPDPERETSPEVDDHAPPPTPNRRRRVWIWAAIGVAIVFLGGAGWYWLHGKGATRGGQPPVAQNQQQGAASGPQRGGGKIPVQVAEVTAADLPIYLTGLGTVQAYNTVVVRSRVDGELQKIGFTEGQIVQAGDLVAQIDPRSYQAALDQAVAKKKQDEATLASNRLDLERTRQLAKNSFASQQQLDQQTANVGSLTAQIAYDQASIENAQTQFGYATIRAPITGRTGLRLVDQGNIVHASDQTGIVEIAQIQPIAVIFTAPQRQLPMIAEAMRNGPVEVAALSSDNKSVLDVGRLELINNAVDAATGTIRLKAAFPNVTDRLWPGLSVNTRLLQKTLNAAVSVPAEAVQRGQNVLFAYVVGDDGKAEKREIEVSTFSEGRAVIDGGLRVGEKVVTAGQYRLTAGAAVDARPTTARGQGAGQGGGTDDNTPAATPSKGQ